MANAEAIVEVVDTLGLSTNRNEFAVFGGACLALRGIREARDLELFVAKRVANRLKSQGWRTESYSSGQNPHLLGRVIGIEVQVFSGWDCPGWQPDIRSYLHEPEIVLGLPCMPLDDLIEWKRETARPKDLRDLALVERWGEG